MEVRRGNGGVVRGPALHDRVSPVTIEGYGVISDWVRHPFLGADCSHIFGVSRRGDRAPRARATRPSRPGRLGPDGGIGNRYLLVCVAGSAISLGSAGGSPRPQGFLSSGLTELRTRRERVLAAIRIAGDLSGPDAARIWGGIPVHRSSGVGGGNRGSEAQRAGAGLCERSEERRVGK